MQAIKNLLSPLSGNSNPIQDTLKLVVIGGTVETARRASVSAWNGFIDSFFLTAHFSQEDYPYDCREFDITTRSVNRHGLTQKTSGDLEEENEDDEESAEFSQGGGRKRKVAIVPSMGKSAIILRITRTKRFQDYGSCAELKISVVARNNDILKRLVLEAKREYEKDAEHRVHIFMADTYVIHPSSPWSNADMLLFPYLLSTYGCWRWNGARQKRPMSSIVLEPGVKDMILADCKDFLASEDWYAERGIPFRRGYLLHGVPGSGKTSLIHSLAGELGLDIYVVSLSSKGMSDNTLTTLMGNVPSRCILLLEDLDAAFTRGISRDETSTGTPLSSSSSSSSSSSPKNKDDNDGSTLSLSGLLNSLDGVAAAEGRLLFATTNHIERLDPALSRPGRMDVWVNFKHATKWQAEGIFKCFFPARTNAAAGTSASQSGGPTGSSTSAAGAKHPADAMSSANLAESKRKRAAHAIPALSEEEISDLAKRFGDAIPENELSVAALQGYLLKNKTRPRECVDEVAAWVVSERETREKMKKEKEEREAKEKKEAEEKAKKEKEEKATKEKAEKKEARVKAKRNALREASKASAAASPTESGSSTAIEGNSSDSAPETPADSLTLSSSEAGTSASESENASGGDADTEESVTSEEESDKAAKPAGLVVSVVDAATGKEKWVAVRAQPLSDRASAVAL
ncbi:hypothetical protein BN946_scf184851.g98 [Trametes cinnabarina]|uniref:AAA+ ATPase domain-containing protein n=1 Tax=Pycnoporus cinnabarinus TaxID=5643 RepID=A0A060S5S8_PYCCI|nr:hypothetical protein BN946_scf184851.g98 [Trametes cinnabarina]